MITLIWCEDNCKGIGYKNKLPWCIPEEMNHFKNITLNKIVVMGKNTFTSINSKPLNNRINVVISKSLSKELNSSNLKIFNSLNSFKKEFKNKDFYVIGGLSLYKMFLPIAENLIISKLKQNYKCDIFIKDINLENFEVKKIENFELFDVFYMKRIK